MIVAFGTSSTKYLPASDSENTTHTKTKISEMLLAAVLVACASVDRARKCVHERACASMSALERPITGTHRASWGLHVTTLKKKNVLKSMVGYEIATT